MRDSKLEQLPFKIKEAASKAISSLFRDKYKSKYESKRKVNLEAFLIGTIFSWPSPSLPKLTNRDPDINPLGQPLGDQEASWLASVNFLSACIGAILPSMMIKRLGRKITLFILGVPCLIGYIMFAFGSHVAVFFIGRILCGLSLGASFQIVPMYVGEISETKNRGAMGSYFSIFMALGHIFNLALGPYVSFQIHNICLAIFPATFLLLLMIYVQDSPYDHVAKGDFIAAEKILHKLRCNSSDAEIKEEMNEIDRCIKAIQDDLKLTDLFKSKALRKSLIITIGVAIFQQLSGVNAVMSYMQDIFSEAGGQIPPEMSPIYVGIVQLLATLFNPQVVDRFGRKMLLAISQFGLFISMMGLGTFFYVKFEGSNVDNITWLPLLCLITFIIFFNTGPGSVLYVIMGEIFPSNAKNVASTLTSFFLSLFGFIVTWLFPFIVDAVDLGITFWIAGACSFLGFLMVVLVIPETKGKSFIEIQKLLVK